MPTYYIEAMDVTGQEVKDTIEADDEQAASADVQRRGYFITRIKRQKTREEATAEREQEEKTMQEDLANLPGYGADVGWWLKAVVISGFAAACVCFALACVIWFFANVATAEWSFWTVQRWTMAIGVAAVLLLESVWILWFIPTGVKAFAEEWGVPYNVARKACTTGFVAWSERLEEQWNQKNPDQPYKMSAAEVYKYVWLKREVNDKLGALRRYNK